MRTFFNLTPEYFVRRPSINQQKEKGIVNHIYVSFNKMATIEQMEKLTDSTVKMLRIAEKKKHEIPTRKSECEMERQKKLNINKLGTDAKLKPRMLNFLAHVPSWV